MSTFKFKDLEKALDTLKYKLLGYAYSREDSNDMLVKVELIEEDPGKGIMTGCIQISAVAPKKEGSQKVIEAVAEVYPSGEMQAPRFSLKESWAIED